MTNESRKPLKCKLGLHMSWYTDSAVFNRAMRCNDCGAYADPREKAELERERKYWAQATAAGLDFEAAQKQVCLRLSLPTYNARS